MLSVIDYTCIIVQFYKWLQNCLQNLLVVMLVGCDVLASLRATSIIRAVVLPVDIQENKITIDNKIVLKIVFVSFEIHTRGTFVRHPIRSFPLD